jgi:hypothetical protein
MPTKALPYLGSLCIRGTCAKEARCLAMKFQQSGILLRREVVKYFPLRENFPKNSRKMIITSKLFKQLFFRSTKRMEFLRPNKAIAVENISNHSSKGSYT